VPTESNTRRPTLEDTFTRLLRLGHAASGQSLGPLVSRTRMMDESEQALHDAATIGPPLQQMVATRILDCPETFKRWETEHLQLVSRIADQLHLGRQASTTLSTTFSLVHAKSLFEYLRNSGIRKHLRRRLIAHFYGDNGYVKALISEHGKYLRSAASLLCLKHVGNHVIGHTAFGQPMDDYEQMYAEYFRCYCQWVVPDQARQDVDTLNALQQEQKSDVLLARQRLRALPLRPRLKR
jgi:hypothetical protein